MPKASAYFIWHISANLIDSSIKLPLYLGIFIFGIKYSKAVPDHETKPFLLSKIVKVLLKLFQCFTSTSLFIIATRLACLASEASKS